ncbi:hypothetical protein [Leptothoe sp. PORK10 BA2]|uniref:hypothetical protein n=1 Tax=Leptothoe sp. PORK10 BA2 TaxID=3110254 RepID=UPI002B1F2584|nr:hypothetical protein [Leptothoe sp. PORK10 BA2]MEA5465724.1 hypothetical protein [Leptothoe sp. PORK10 BA2]
MVTNCPLLVELLECPVARTIESNDDGYYLADTQPRLIAFQLATPRQPGDSSFTEPLKLAVEVVHVAEDSGQVEAR